MTTPMSGRDPVEKLAEEFADRFRRGERPSLKEYTDRYPELAEDIRDLFPALVVMEQFGSVAAPPTGSFPEANAEEARIPEQLGDYRILREVGRGGMGIVYEAIQESLGRRVALKVLPYHRLMNPQFLERFKREARAAAKLHHTNIVPVFGVGEHDGVPFYAMQFIQGQGLELVLGEVRRLRAQNKKYCVSSPEPVQDPAATVAHGMLTGHFDVGALQKGDACSAATLIDSAASSSVHNLMGNEGVTSSISASQPGAEYFRSVARIGLQLADALSYAHRHGILHRDIKPSNLLLDTQGTVWITDFGLAKDEGNIDLTSPGDIVGTMRFMAPERFHGRGDPRSDIYAAGVTLYELLTLRPAFNDFNQARLIDRVTKEDPIQPRKLDPHIPRDLETIVLKAIAKEPASRYQSADELAEDLRRFLADRPVRARRASPVERFIRWYRRNLAVAVMTTVAALLLVVLAIGASVAAFWLDLKREAVEKSLKQAEEAEHAKTNELAKSFLEEARARRYSRQAGQRFKCLEALAKSAEIVRSLELGGERLVELRNNAIAALALPDLQIDKEWEGCPVGTLNTAFDDALENYARRDERGTISIRRVKDDEEFLNIPGPGQGRWQDVLCFSPDSRYFATTFAPERTLKVWRLADHSIVFDGSLYKGVFRAAFTPDSRRIVCARADGSLLIVNLIAFQENKRPTGEKERGGLYQWLMSIVPGVRWLPPVGNEPRSISCSPDGRQVAVSSGATIHIRDLDTGKVIHSFDHPNVINNVAWHPHGKMLAAGCEDRHVYVWDITSNKLAGALEGFRNWGVIAAFSPNGELLVTCGWEGMLRLWNVRTRKELFSTPAAMVDLHFSRDGRRLAGYYHGTTLGIFELAEGIEYRTLVSRAGFEKENYNDGAISPDGRLFAAGMEQGARLWDLAGGDELAYLPTGGRTPGVLFLPNGDLFTGALSDGGLQRWPLTSDARDPVLYQLGQPQTLYRGPVERLARSRDGKSVAFNPAGQGALILERGSWVHRLPVLRHDGGNYVAVNATGDWVVTGTWSGRGVKIWSTRDHKLHHELPCDGNSYPIFSSDNRWLAVGTDSECRLYRVDSWEPGPRFPISYFSCGAFSPDSRVLAVSIAHSIIGLVDPETGQIFAQLEDPNQDRPNWLGFTPDGAKLAVTTNDSRSIHLWDLRRVREQLAKMDMDWGLPTYPPEPERESESPVRIRYGSAPLDPSGPLFSTKEQQPLNVAVESLRLARNLLDAKAYNRRGRAHEILDQPRKALFDYTIALALGADTSPERISVLLNRAGVYNHIGEFEKALVDLKQAKELNPTKPETLNNLAWFYVTAPAPFRDPKEALTLIQQAIGLAPRRAMFLNTLGVTYERLGEYEKAVVALERSLRESKEMAAAFDLFVLAKCYHHLNDRSRAQACFDRAITWVAHQDSELPPTWRAELAVFRAEAEKALEEKPWDRK